MTAAVILAAGASTRLGRPKQTVLLDGETLLERAVRIATQARLSPVIVVLRPEADFGYGMQQLDCVVIVNPEADEGIASSIRCGVTAASLLGADGVVLMTCDQAGLTKEHLSALVQDPRAVAGSVYAGRTAIPAYFPAGSFEDLQKLAGDTGARALLESVRGVTNELLAFDIDTPADLARLGSGHD